VSLVAMIIGLNELTPLQDSAHTAIPVKLSADGPPRESIEVRALVFTYPPHSAVNAV
jgi:hypothetical protein